MGLKDMMQNKIVNQGAKYADELNKNMKALLAHMIQIEKNQVETETYLKDILTRLKNHENQKGNGKA